MLSDLCIINMFNLSTAQYYAHSPSVLIDTFTLYKQISKQYCDQNIVNSIRQLVPEKMLKLNSDELLKPLFQWFKNDFMSWMPKIQNVELVVCF